MASPGLPPLTQAGCLLSPTEINGMERLRGMDEVRGTNRGVVCASFDFQGYPTCRIVSNIGVVCV